MENDPDQHPDDHLVKGLFKKHAAGILPYLMPGLTIIGPLEDDDTEILFGEEEQTVSQGQYQIDPIIREDPTVMAIMAEAKAKGEIKGRREAILDFVSARFSSQVVTQVQQTVAPIQDIQLLSKFNRQLVRVSNEQEVTALLAECFPHQDKIDPLITEDPAIRTLLIKSSIEGETKGVRDSILAVVSARFSPQAVTQVQQALTPVQDAQQLKKFLRQLVRVSNEQEISALLAQHFPTH